MQPTTTPKSKRPILLYIFLAFAAFTLLYAFFGPEPAPTLVIVNIREVAGKTPDEVSNYLGPAKKLYDVKDRRSGCGKDKECPKFSYRKDSIEVAFINGKADWITVNVNGKKWEESAIELIGLSKTPPTGKAPGAFRWTNIEGFNEVAVFPGKGDEISMFYIKTVTE